MLMWSLKNMIIQPLKMFGLHLGKIHFLDKGKRKANKEIPNSASSNWSVWCTDKKLKMGEKSSNYLQRFKKYKINVLKNIKSEWMFFLKLCICKKDLKEWYDDIILKI